MDDLQAFENWADPLLAKLTPAARRKLAMDIGRALRRSQQKRIAAQQAPDGSQFEPRKPRKREEDRPRAKAGRVKRKAKAMFAKLRTAKMMTIERDADGVSIGWSKRVARIARVHQEGLSSQVARGGVTYRYPVRQVLGLSESDRDMIRDMLTEALAP